MLFFPHLKGRVATIFTPLGVRVRDRSGNRPLGDADGVLRGRGRAGLDFLARWQGGHESGKVLQLGARLQDGLRH
jgi:hypothetical protein